MTIPENIPDAILQNALGPKRVQEGGRSIDQQSIDEQIAADRYTKAQAASASTRFGLRTKTIKPIYP